MRDPYGFLPLDIAHYGRVETYADVVRYIYDNAIKEAVKLGLRRIGPTNKPFSFDLVPETKKRFNQILSLFANQVEKNIVNGINAEWLKSAEKNDRLVNAVLKGSRLKPDQVEQFMNRNLEALNSFQSRKVNGMNLSDRVWRTADQFKQELEMSIDLGIGEGTPATKLATEVKRNLQDPDRLFRRVRDKHGVLQLSKNAAAYHPGQGVYRSSYKNALRLTRTEINMAYRTADFERIQQLPFVGGIEVVLSNNHPVPDICDDLKGKYPKDFVFRGWHPQCRCHTLTVLATEDEVDKMTDAILRGDDPAGISVKNQVEGTPAGFKDWRATNDERIKGWKSKPWFMTDNPGYVK